MLSIDNKLTREQNSARLGRIKSDLARYFGFATPENIAEALAFAQAVGQTEAAQVPLTPTTANGPQVVRSRLGIRADPELQDVFELLLDSGEGSRFAITGTGSILELLAAKVRDARGDRNKLIKLARCAKLHYCNTVRTPVASSVADSSAAAGARVLYDNLGVIGFGNSADEQAAKQRLSVFRVEHPMIVPGNKNAELLTVFFNAFPAIELTRATPVLNLKVYSSRQVFQNGKLGAISLQKFLEGARTVSPDNATDMPVRAIALANQVTASLFGQTDQEFSSYSLTGLELFTAPQTLVNPSANKQQGNYLAPVIDPFRPLASIKNFDVEVRSAVGLISTKTAKLEMTLHDRSRLGEFADFVKPDRYGSSFVEVEYGWSHPDGLDVGNPYADLLNLTRVKEQYNIVNSSFNFDEVGQVNITLNLATRGSSEMTELSITGNQPQVREYIRAVERLSREINALSDQVFGTRQRSGNNTSSESNSNSSHRREIRGQQMLTAAGDATSYLILTPELFTSLAQLRRTLTQRISGDSSPAVRRQAQQLKARLDELVGTSSNSVSPNSRIGIIQSTINNDVSTAISMINRDTDGQPSSDPLARDIFLREMPSVPRSMLLEANGTLKRRQSGIRRDANTANGQVVGVATPSQTRSASGRVSSRGIVSDGSVISLGSLIMALVAKPLAKVKNADGFKFDEVQTYFYNFNTKAGPMSHCNISQFPVYTDFFAREYSRLRLENSSRTVDLSVTEFVSFIASRMIDDPMNPAYGINGLYRPSTTSDELVARTNGDEFNRNMQRIMRAANIGQSPDFVMPQITLDIEAVPHATDETKSILKLHIYDKACSPNNTLRELLSLSTDSLLSNLSAYPGDDQSRVAQEEQNRAAGATGVPRHVLRDNWREIHAAITEHARATGLIEAVQGTNGSQYRFVGGPKRLKELVMQYVPHIIYGCMGSTVKAANLSTMQNALLATINMQRSLNGDPVDANGEQPGGVPLSVYPVELSVTALGCPFVRYSQELFMDFNTNTTADNIYYVTGLSHKIEPGTFETTVKLTATDAFGQYRNLIGQLNNAQTTLNAIVNSNTNNRNQQN